MHFALIVLLLVPFAIADDEKKPTAKETVVLSPEKQMEKAIAEYKKLYAESLQFISSPAFKYNPKALKQMREAASRQRLEVIALHKSLGIERDGTIYEASTTKMLEVEKKLEKLRKRLAENASLLETNPESSSALEEDTRKIAAEHVPLACELVTLLLVQELNKPLAKSPQ